MPAVFLRRAAPAVGETAVPAAVSVEKSALFELFPFYRPIYSIA